MASTVASSSSDSARGVVLMTLAMLVIPLVDGLAKYLSVSYSPLFLGWARYAVASLIVVPLAAGMHGPRVFPAERLFSHVLRTVFLVAAMTLYFLAVARIPLATAVSGFLVGPIIAVVLAVVVLKERMTSGKVLALAAGVVGALVIVQPGGSTDPGVLLALGAGTLFALYLIATRRASQASDPIRTLAFQCVVGTLLLTPQALMSWRTPQWNDVVFFVGLGGISAIGHLMSIAAFRFSGASTLAPLVYVELIGATSVGYFAFHEVPGLRPSSAPGSSSSPASSCSPRIGTSRRPGTRGLPVGAALKAAPSCRKPSAERRVRRARPSAPPGGRVPPARGQVVEPNQIHVIAAAVSCDPQQIIHALESRFTGQVVCDIGDVNRRNRIHDDVAVVHRVATTHLDMGTRPDANAASDSTPPDSLAKAFGEHHVEPIARPRSRDRRNRGRF